MSYSDLQLKNATQVAYQNFQKPFQQLINAGQKPPIKIIELCEQMINDKYTTADKVYNHLFPDLDNEDIRNWAIVDIYDSNKNTVNDTGFYGCVIDVGEGDAIVAFRGSEGATDLSNLQHDWIEADLGLVNSTLTIQQGEVYKFLKKISESDYINNYDSLGLTGHSLGGNLAMHGAIVSAMPEIGLDDKLKRCVSYDGPGYSDEYIDYYEKYINKVSGKITHYKWSPVGGLLFELPNVSRIPLKFEEKDDFIYNLIGRHSTTSIIFDGENAVHGDETTWDILTSKFSKGIDHMPSIIGDTLVSTLSALLYGGMWMYTEMFKDNEITPFGVSVITAAAKNLIAIGPIKTVKLVASLLFIATVSFFAVIAYEYTYEFIEYIINEAAEAVTKFCSWLKDKADELKAFISKGLDYLKNWFNNNLNVGYKYASSNPQIKVDTYKLRSYAQRLQSVNSRISRLDRRLDSLYWDVGLLDLWNLMQADLLTGYSWRLQRAATYLNDTAFDFEKAENELVNSL